MPKIVNGDSQDVSRFLHSLGFRTLGHRLYSDCYQWESSWYALKFGKFIVTVVSSNPSAKHQTARIGISFSQQTSGPLLQYRYAGKNWRFDRRVPQKDIFGATRSDIYMSSNWKTRFLDSLVKALKFSQTKSNSAVVRGLISKLDFARKVA